MYIFSDTALPTGKKSATENEIRILAGMHWHQAVMSLHKQVREEMPQEQRHYLLPRTPEYFRDLLTGKSGLLLGAFADGGLVGSMALSMANGWTEAKERKLITFPDKSGALAKKYRKAAICVFQAMGLRQAYMGRKLSCSLLRAGIKAAVDYGCTHLFAQTAEQNALSWLRFMERGFAVIAAWSGGHSRFLLRWLPPEEKARLLLSATPENVEKYAKSYVMIPMLTARINAGTAQGKTVFLASNNRESEFLTLVSC